MPDRDPSLRPSDIEKEQLAKPALDRLSLADLDTQSLELMYLPTEAIDLELSAEELAQHFEKKYRVLHEFLNLIISMTLDLPNPTQQEPEIKLDLMDPSCSPVTFIYQIIQQALRDDQARCKWHGIEIDWSQINQTNKQLRERIFKAYTELEGANDTSLSDFEEADTWNTVELIDAVEPYTSEETVFYREKIADLAATLDESDARSLKQVSAEIRTILLPLIEREADTFPHGIMNFQYTEVQSIVLTAEAQLFRVSCLEGHLDPNELVIRRSERTAPDRLWIDYADALVNFLTDPRIGQAKRDGQAFHEKYPDSDLT